MYVYILLTRAASRRRREDIYRLILPKPLEGLIGLVVDPRALVVVAVPCLVLWAAYWA